MSTSGEEIKVLLTADTTSLQAGMEAGAASVAQSAEEMKAAVAQEAVAFNAAVQAKVDAMVRLNAAFAGGITNTAAIAEAESALDQAMAAGAVTAQEYSGYIATLTASEDAMAASVDVATASLEVNTEATVINSRVTTELGTLLSELASGNIGRMRRSLAALANQSGFLAKAFTGIGPAILGVAGAVIAFGVAAVKGAEEQAKFAGAIAMTGDAAGVTTGDLENMAQRVGEASGSFGEAKTALLAIVDSGKIAASQIQEVGIASQEMAKLTGDSVDKSVSAFVKLQEKPVQAVVALNDQYHFLTRSVFDQIDALQKEGDTQGAARIATDAYAQALATRSSEMEAHLGTLARAWNSVKDSASWAWGSMLNIGKDSTLNDKVANAQTALEHLQSMGLATFNEKAGHVGWEATDKGKNDSAVAFEIANLKKLQDAQSQAQDAAKKKAADASQVKQYTDDASALEKWNAGLKDNLNLQSQIADHKAQIEKVHKESPNAPGLKGYTFDASGAVTGGEQWTATVAKLTKEYGEHLTPAIRVSGHEAAKASQQAMTALEMQRSGTQANTAERIQADAALLASATKLYGAMSSQQASALRQMLADSKAYDAAYLKSQEDMEKQIEKDHKKNNEAIAKASKDAAAKATAAWKGYLDPVNHAFQTTINGMIQGTQTFRQSMAHLLQSIEASFIEYGIKDLEHYIITQQAKTAATAAGAAERATIESGAAAQSKAIDATTGKSQITSAAATGAAKAYQAIVGIPYVGPILAPIAAGVAFAGIEAFSGMISSARGGWERVPIDGMMTELHKDEMVLPAHVANPIRDMAKGGGQGGQGAGTHFHISAMDMRSFADAARRHEGTFANVMKRAARNGHFSGALR